MKVLIEESEFFSFHTMNEENRGVTLNFQSMETERREREIKNIGDKKMKKGVIV